MRFEALALIDVISMAIGIGVAILMAAFAFRYWSLVGMIAATALTNAILVWVLCKWRPGLPRRHCGVRSMLQFGGSLTGFSFLNYLTRNADNVIIGFFVGSAPLGIYTKAYALLLLPIRQVNVPVSHVMLPALSRLQHDAGRYRRAYLSALSAMSTVGMPIVVAAFVLADEVVAIFLGGGWEQAAVVFRWLAPAAFFGTLNVAPGWLCVSLGRPGIQIRWALIMAPLTVACFLLGVRWGVTGVAAAFSAAWCSGFILFVFMACKGTPVKLRDIVGAVAPQVVASLVAAMVGATLLKSFTPHIPHVLPRATIIALFIAAAYGAVLCTMPTSRRLLRGLLRDGLRATMPAER